MHAVTMSEKKKQPENSAKKTGQQSVETPPAAKRKLASPAKKTNETKKLKNKSNDSVAPKQVRRTNSADGRIRTSNVEGSKVKAKDGPAVSPRLKPKSSKEHGPRRKDMKAFVIPRMAKEKELLEEVSLDSNSFQKYLLPAIVQQYRDPASRASFEYEKAFLVHNEKLNTEFQERRKELKEEGRSDRELAEQYSFLLVDNMDIAKLICKEGLHARWTGDAKERQLGRGEMGVYLNRYSDILSSASLEPGKEYILLVLKVLKGKVKAVPLTHHKGGTEPTPKFDSHVAKNIVVTSTNRFQTFVSNQIYCYQFGDLDMETRPKQICPFAVVHFTYSEKKKEANTTSSGFEIQVSITKKDAVGNKADSSKGPKKPAPMSTAFASSITLWKGKLANRGKELCNASLVSSRLPFLPTELPRRLDLATAIPVSKVKSIMPSDISKHPKLCHLSRHHEVSAKGRYFTYAQMRSLGDKKAFSELFKCLKDNQMALHTKTTSNKQVFILPPCSLTEELHVSKSAKLCVLHILFVSNKTSYRTVSDAVLKHSSNLKDANGPSLPIFGKAPKASDLKAQLGKIFQQENTFYIAENEKRKPTTPARISPATRNSRTSSQGDSSRSSTENTPVAVVLKDATNSIPSQSKSIPNHDTSKINANIPVGVPFSGRLEHVEGSFSPIEEEEAPPKEDSKGSNNVTKSDTEGPTAVGTSNVPQGEEENIPGQSPSFGHPPKPTRVFSNQSHLPEINHQLSQLLRTQEIIASTSSSSASGTPSRGKDTIEDCQNKIRQLRSNLDSLLRERASLKHSEELAASFQMAGRHPPPLSSHHTPTQQHLHHQPQISSGHDPGFLPSTSNEHEPFLGSSSLHPSEFPKFSSNENRSQIFDYLQDILTSPFLRQTGNLGMEERDENRPDDPLSPAGLTLDSLRSILDRVQGQSPSVSDSPPYPLSMQHHDASMDLTSSTRPGPSHLGVSPTSSDVENNNKRQMDGGEASSSKRQRTEDSNNAMAKLASILSNVSKAVANVPATPQSPPPWETLSLVHKEIPPETPESPPPWDRCNDVSNQGEDGVGDQWSRNVVLKEDQSKQLTVTIKGHPTQRQTQESSSDLYGLVKTVLHGVTRKLLLNRGALKLIPGSGVPVKMASAALRNENDFAPPTQQEVHLQELVLSTLHVQNPGNSQIQYGASRKVEEVARPLQENHNSSSSQRTSPRSGNSPRTSSSVSTGSNHSDSPMGKGQTNRSSIIEDGTSFLGDLTSEDGVSVDLPYYRKKTKERHRKSSNAKVPKHRSSDIHGGSLVVKRRVTSNFTFSATLPPPEFKEQTNASDSEGSDCFDYLEEDPMEMDDSQEDPTSSAPADTEEGVDICQENVALSETGSPVHKQVDEVSTSTLKLDNTGVSDEEGSQNRSLVASLSDMSVSCTSSPDPEIEVNVGYVVNKGPSSNDDAPATSSEGSSVEKGQSDVCTNGEVTSTVGLKMSGENIPSVDISAEEEKEENDTLKSSKALGSVDQSQTTFGGGNISEVEIRDKSEEESSSVDRILDDPRTIQDEPSLSESFLVPSDPLATFLNLNREEDEEPVSSHTPSKMQDKPGLATPIGKTIRNDKVLSILFGTALKSPVGVAFKCSTSQEEFHVIGDDNINSTTKKQILEERFFQRQKCLATTFKTSEIIGGLRSQSKSRSSSDEHQSSKTHDDGGKGEGVELLCDTVSSTVDARVTYGEETCSSTGSPVCDNPTRGNQVPSECQDKDNNGNLDYRRIIPKKVGLNLFEKAVKCQSHYFIHKAEKDKINTVQTEQETDGKCSSPSREILRGSKHSKDTILDDKSKQCGRVGHSEAATGSGRDSSQNEPSKEFRNLSCSSKGPVVAGGSIGELILPLRKSQLDQCKKEPECRKEREAEVVQEGEMEGECSVVSCKRKKTVLSRGDADCHSVIGLSLRAQKISTDALEKKSGDCENVDMGDRNFKWKVDEEDDDDDKTVIYEGDEGEEDELNISTPEIMKMLDEELAGHQDDPSQERQGSVQRENDEGELQDVLKGGNDGDCEGRVDQPTKLKAAKWQRKSFLTLNSFEVEKVSSTSEDESALTIAEKEIKTSDSVIEQKQEHKDSAGKRVQETTKLKTGNVDGSVIAAVETVVPLMDVDSPPVMRKANSCNTSVHQEHQKEGNVLGNQKEQHQSRFMGQSQPSGITSAQQGSKLSYSCSPGARSSPGGPSTRTELNSLVSELRSEIKRKLKEHTQKVVKGLIKMKGLKYEQGNTILDGSNVCWRGGIQIKKERRKKMKLKRVKYRSKGQRKGQSRTTESLVALQSLDDLASKLSKCSIDHEVGGKVEWFLSPIRSKEMSPLKKRSPLTGSTKPRCGLSPRTLPFKKDFTASMSQHNVFGAFSPKVGVNLSPVSSPWRLTLVKSGEDSKGYQLSKKTAKTKTILKEATFISLSKDNKEDEGEYTEKTDSHINKATPSSGYPKAKEAPVSTSKPSSGELKPNMLQGENISSKKLPSPTLAQQNSSLNLGRQINETSNMQQWLDLNPPLYVPRHPLLLHTHWTMPVDRPLLVPMMNYQMIPPNPILSLQNQVASIAFPQPYSLPLQGAGMLHEWKQSHQVHSQTISYKQGNSEPRSSVGVPRVGPSTMASQNAGCDVASSTDVTDMAGSQQVKSDMTSLASFPSSRSQCQRDLRIEGRVDVGNQLDNSHLSHELSAVVAGSSSSENHCVVASSQQAESYNEESEQSSGVLEEELNMLSKCPPEDVSKEPGSQGKRENDAVEIIDVTRLDGSEEISSVDINSETCDVESEKDARMKMGEKEDGVPDSVSSKIPEVTSEFKEDVISVSSGDASGIGAIVPDDIKIKSSIKTNLSRCVIDNTGLGRSEEVSDVNINSELCDIDSEKDARIKCEKAGNVPYSASSKITEVTLESKEDVISVSSDDASGIGAIVPDDTGIESSIKTNSSTCVIDDTSLGRSEEVSHVDISSELWDIDSEKDARMKKGEKEDNVPDSVSSKIPDVTSESKEDVISVSSDDASGIGAIVPDDIRIKSSIKIYISRCDSAKPEAGKKNMHVVERKTDLKEKDVEPDDKGAVPDGHTGKGHEGMSHGIEGLPSAPKIESFESRFETNEDKSVINDDRIMTMDGIHKPDEDIVLQNENAVTCDGSVGIPDDSISIPDASLVENSDKGVVPIPDKVLLDKSEEMKEKETDEKKVTAKEETTLSKISDVVTNKDAVLDEILEIDEDDEALMDDDLLLSSGEHSADFDRVKDVANPSVVEDDVLSVGDDISSNDFTAAEDTLERCKSSAIDDFSAEIDKNDLSKDVSGQEKSLSSNGQPKSLLQSITRSELQSASAQSDQDVVNRLYQKTEKPSSSHLKNAKDWQKNDKSELRQVEVKGTRSPVKKSGRVRKLSGGRKAAKLKTAADQDIRPSGKGRVREDSVKESKKNDERSKKKEKSVSHQRSPVRKPSRVVKIVHASSPSKDMWSPKKRKTASKRRSGETEDQVQKRTIESSSPTSAKRTKLSFLPDCKLTGFQIPKLSSKEQKEASKGEETSREKKETSRGDDVKPVVRCSQIATLDPVNKTVKINLKHAVVELNRLKLDLKSKKKSGQKESSKDQRKVNLSKPKESPLLGKIRLKDVKETRSSKTHSRGRDSAIGKPSRSDERNESSKIKKLTRDDEEKISSSLSQKLSKNLLKRLGKKHHTDEGAGSSSKETTPQKVKSSSERRTVSVAPFSKTEKRKHVVFDIKSKGDQSSGASLDNDNTKDSKLTTSHSKSATSLTGSHVVKEVILTPGQVNRDVSSDESTPGTPARKFWRTYESKMSPVTEATFPPGKIVTPVTSEIWRVVDEVFPSPGDSQGCPSMKLPREGNSKESQADSDKMKVCKENEVEPLCNSSMDGQPIPTICSTQASSFRYSESGYVDVVKQNEFDYLAPISSSEAAQGSSYVQLPTGVRNVVTIENRGNHPPTENSLPSQGSCLVDLVGNSYTASNDATHDGDVTAVTHQQDKSFKPSNVVGQTTSSESFDRGLPIQTIESSYGMQLPQSRGDSHVATSDAKGLHGHMEADKTRPPTPHPLVSSAGDGPVPISISSEPLPPEASKAGNVRDLVKGKTVTPSQSSKTKEDKPRTVEVGKCKKITSSSGMPAEVVPKHPQLSQSDTRLHVKEKDSKLAKEDVKMPVKSQEEKNEKITTSKEQGKNKVSVSSTNQANSSGPSKTSLKSKPVKGGKRFHPYMPHRVKSINLVHCKHLVVPRMEELMWNHTFISPKLKQIFPPRDIFSTPSTDPGRFLSVGQLHHQETTLKNADEVEPKAMPGMVTDAKKMRVKTLDASLLKMAAATDDIQKLLELDEMVYALKNEAVPSRPLRAHSSVRYHPYI